MYIFPKHPEEADSSAWIERSLRIGEYFDVLLHSKYDYCGNTFEQLAHYGINLSDELIYILVQFETKSLWTADMLLHKRPNPLIRMLHAIFGAVFQMHLFTSDGRLYALLVFDPPLQGEKFRWQVTNCAMRLIESVPAWELHILVSRDENGQQGIFHAANSLRDATDYLRFCNETPQISFIDLKQQTALGDNSEIYRQFSVSLAERLGDPDFQPKQAAKEAFRLMQKHSACSIASLHWQMQSFSLIFLTHLVDKTIIDKSFLQKNNISDSIMDGDSEESYICNLASILSVLHRRRQELNEYFNTAHLHQIYTYIEQHISSLDLSVSQLAELYGVNRSQLTAQFRAYYGQSLSRFIQTKRLERAKILIESHPSWGMERVSREAGYCVLSTMYRAFQQAGLGTPAQYRQRYQNRKEV